MELGRSNKSRGRIDMNHISTRARAILSLFLVANWASLWRVRLHEIEIFFAVKNSFSQIAGIFIL